MYHYCTFDALLYLWGLMHISYNYIRIFVGFMLSPKIPFFLSLENWLEIITNVCVTVALTDESIKNKLNFASVAVITGFSVYAISLKKIRFLGVYVLAVLKTLKNSAKFFPVFLIIIFGYIISFYMRFSYGITLCKYAFILYINILEKNIFLLKMKMI